MYVQRLWDGAYGLSSLSEKTKKFINRLQMLFHRATISPQLVKDPELVHLVASRLADRRLYNWANRSAINSEGERTDPGI